VTVVSERIRRLACGAVLGVALCAPPVFAQPSAADKETARSLMDKGDKAFDSKDYAAALKSYLAAHAIMKVPTTGIEVARAQIALGHLLDGRETALGVSRSQPTPNEPKAFAKARAEAGELAQSLVARIPSVEVKVSGPPENAAIRVVIDGTELPAAASTAPRKVDPGQHTVEVSAPGFATATEKVDVSEGENRVVELTLSPESGGGAGAGGTQTPANDALVTGDSGTSDGGGGVPALAYVGFGLGVVGIAVGSVTGLMSLSKASSAEERCVDKRCPPEAQDDIDSSKSMALISNIGFGVGIVGIGVGVVALLSSGGKEEGPPPPAAARFTPVVGLGYVGVDGRF
jgi:hypothetical protein